MIIRAENKNPRAARAAWLSLVCVLASASVVLWPPCLYVRVSCTLLVVAVCVAVCLAMFSSGVVARASVFVSMVNED